VFFFLDSRPYVAIIGDIINSRLISNRFEIQEKLIKTLEEINLKYSDNIESNFMITLGDEFQGLLKDGANIINIIEFIQIKMYPIRIRFGIGIGKIETEINRLVPIGSDGSAYHNARQMIDNLKDVGKKNKTFSANIMIASDGCNSDVETLLNTILSLCTVIRRKWSSRQREVIFDCILNGDNQRKAAERLNISQPTVQRTLSFADYYTYLNAMNVVSDALVNIQVDSNV